MAFRSSKLSRRAALLLTHSLYLLSNGSRTLLALSLTHTHTRTHTRTTRGTLVRSRLRRAAFRARCHEKAVRALEALEAPRALGRYLVAQRRLGRFQVRLALLLGEQLLLDVLQGACARAAGVHSCTRCGALAAGQGKA